MLIETIRSIVYMASLFSTDVSLSLFYANRGAGTLWQCVALIYCSISDTAGRISVIRHLSIEQWFCAS